MVRCAGCDQLFVAPRPPRGPRAAYCSQVCRQRAYRERLHLEVAVEAADLALSCSHSRLAEAVAALPPHSAMMLRDLLLDASDRNLSTPSGDGLCRSSTTPGDRVVVDLHTKEAL